MQSLFPSGLTSFCPHTSSKLKYYIIHTFWDFAGTRFGGAENVIACGASTKLHVAAHDHQFTEADHVALEWCMCVFISSKVYGK